MKNALWNASLLAGKVDARTMRLFWLILTLTLFVLGAGATGSDGGHAT